MRSAAQKPLAFVWLLGGLCLIYACAPRSRHPGTPLPSPAVSVPAFGPHGEVDDLPDGATFTDAQFGFRITGPAGWRVQRAFSDPDTRVAFIEPVDAGCSVRVFVGGSLDEAGLRAELNKRGHLFYLDRRYDVPNLGELWVGTLELTGTDQTELGYYLSLGGRRLSIVGTALSDRVLACTAAIENTALRVVVGQPPPGGAVSGSTVNESRFFPAQGG